LAFSKENNSVWVIKLGGSLYESHRLPSWLRQLVIAGAGKFVIVPGGGPFADQVRHAQNRWGISNACAHAMALLAMEQFGRLLQSLEPKLCLAASRENIKQALSQGRVPVWLPASELLNHSEIPKSWEVTSDSIAAWLSGKLKASRLILVKKARVYEPLISAHALAEQGIVDAAFPRFLHAIAVPCYYANVDDDHRRITKANIANMGIWITPD
jgi:aspartokinase-like uncharacterized kinase